MRASDIPLTAVSTPSGMLWEWLVMPQGLSNALATFNRLVTQFFRPHSAYAQYYSTGAEDTPHVVVPHDEDLKYRILYEAHDAALSGHLCRDKTYSSVILTYWWPKLYKLMNTYVKRVNG